MACMSNRHHRHSMRNAHCCAICNISAILLIFILIQPARTADPFGDRGNNRGSNRSDDRPIVGLPVRADADALACQHALPCSSAGATFLAEVTVAADHWACALAGGGVFATQRAIADLIDRVSSLFERQTCLRLRLTYAPVVCDAAADPLAYLSGLSRPYALITEVRAVLRDRYAHYASRLNVFLTGFDDASGENGFTYQAAFFQRDFSVIWVRGFDAHELAQNLGFLLNATAARRGVMRVKPGATPFKLARSSRAQIHAFLDANLGKPDGCLPTVAPSTPTPTPTPSPKLAYLKTCEFGFAPDRMIRCVPSRQVGTFLTHFGKVLVYIGQSYGRATVRASVAKGDQERSNGVRIRAIRTFVWSNSDSLKMKRLFGWEHRLVSEQKYHGIARLWANIDMHPKLFVVLKSWASCCYRQLYVHAQVTVEVPTADGVDQSTGFGVFPYRVGCGNPCKHFLNGSPVEAQYPLQKCYTCVPS